VSDVEHLLQQCSRTFALSIPRLPEPLRRQVALGYLVFRLADTIEDEGEATAAQRIAALNVFSRRLLEVDHVGLSQGLADWLRDHRPDHAGYVQLLERGGDICRQLDTIEPSAAECIRHHAGRTIAGMICRLETPEPIRSVAGVREYCYYVAGIVGELCTDLFILDHPPLESDRDCLMKLAVSFGEALQLVNILRDQGVDDVAGRRYVPDAATRERLLQLAEAACGQAQIYVDRLREGGAPAGVVEFNAFNLHLAEATLRLTAEHGPGVKVTRQVVAGAMQQIAVS
jgi:farnesyl-diphosphate farnesyltransferase